ncbi:hypothetical protein R1flu_003807 [Riccia fluitans]|uniref:Uncharacterized protein n=1 Tax=Riccia fluitans TaxID=41844 RepID=A0ABD1YD23_9MARC
MPSTLWSGKPRAPFPWLKPTNKHLVEEELLSRFRTEAERQDYRRKVYAKRVKEEYAKALHAALRTSWHQMEAIEDLKDIAATEKAATKESKAYQEEWTTTQRELNKFDIKREEEVQLSSVPKGKGKGEKGVGKPPKGPLPKVPAEPTQKLASQKGKKMPVQKQAETLEMPDLVLMTQKIGEYVEGIKARKAKEIIDKFEQRQIERKAKSDKEAEDERLKAENEKNMMKALLWEQLNGDEAIRRLEEERVARQKEQELFEKRRQEASALVEARNTEWQEATARDHEIFTMMREDYSDEVYQEWMSWEAEKEMKAEQKRLNRLRTCTEIILQLVTMTEVRNDYKDEFNAEMPPSTWRGWKTLFIKGHILPCPIWREDLPRDHQWADPNEVFAKETVTQYLEEQGEWQSMFPIGKNKELGSILWEILGVVDTQPPPIAGPINLTKFKLKMAVVGAPYSGKTTVANKLQEDFDIVKIELSNVIASALALAEVEEQQHKILVAEGEAKKAELEAQMLEEERKKIRDDLDAEASGRKELVLREKRKPEEVPPEEPPAKSPRDNKNSKPGKNPEKEKEKLKDKDKDKGKEKEKEQQGKGKGKQKGEQEKIVDVTTNKLSPFADKEKSAMQGLKSTEGTSGDTEEAETILDIVPTPVPDPIIDLSYFSPKGRFGMDVRLAREKGLQPPVQALAGLIVLTLANLREYVDAFPPPVIKKGAKNPLQVKKDAIKKEKDKAKEEEAEKNPKVPLKPPLKGGKGGPKGKDGAAKSGTNAAAEEKQWGFVLDGFPSNAQEAKALELLLSGIDEDYLANHIAKASKLAPPPKMDMTEIITSGLDGYLLLEYLEEKEALKRAMGKSLDPKTGRIYHLEYDPPPTKEKGLAQRLKPLEELEDVRRKIMNGAEAWGPLSEHLAKISNVFKVAQVQEDNRNVVDTEEPCNLAQRFLDGWEKTKAAKGAADAAQLAEAAVKEALADAEKASKVATESAEHYWNAKLAETETEKGIDALGGNPLAKKLVKEKVTVTLTKRLDETCKAVEEAEQAAESARAFAMHAEQMAHEARDKVTEADLEFAFHVKTEAEAAAQSAKEAAVRAEALLQKAVAAFESAKAALNPPPEEEKPKTPDKKESGKKGREAGNKEKGKDKENEGGKKQKEGSGKTEAKDAKRETGKASSKGGSAEAKDNSSGPPLLASESVVPQEPPKPPPLEKELAVALQTEWEKVESKYFHDLEVVFYTLNQERAITRDVVVETISNFVAHLQNRDERQVIFNDFQEKYNRVEIADRRDKKVKPKLEQEVVKLEKTLNELIEVRTKKCWELSEQSLISLLDSRVTSLVDLFTALVQTELDRHLQTSRFLKQYFTKNVGTDILNNFSCNLRELTSEPAASFPVPGWLISLSSPLPKLYQAIMKTMQVAYDLLTTAFGPETTDKTKKKGDKEKRDSDKKKHKKEEEKLGKKGRNKKVEKDADDSDKVKEIIEVPPPPIDEGVPPAAGREHQVLVQRLQRIAKVGLNYFLELQPIVDGAYRRMDEWGKARLNAEAEVVNEVLDLVRHSVEENIPIWYRVYLDGDQFVIDEDQLQLECSATVLTNINFWHCKLMEALLAEFRKLALEGGDEPPNGGKEEGKKKQKGKDRDTEEKEKERKEKEKKGSKKKSKKIESSPEPPPETPLGNFVTLAAAKEATDQAIEAIHSSFKDDLKESLLPRLPASTENPRGPFQDWQNISTNMFQEFLEDETKGSKFIDWRAFIIAFVDSHFLYIISSATSEDLIKARKAFIDSSVTKKPPEAAGLLSLEEFLAVPLWFDSTTPIVEGEFDLGVTVKIFVFNTLSDGRQGVPWLKLLLYLCRDPDPYLALQKAFCVISGTISDDTRLTPEEVLLILYPGGVDAAWKAEIVPFVMEDVQNYLYWVAREKYIRREKAEESDFGGSEESDSYDLEVDRASTESSVSARDTVGDFLDFSYKEFPDLLQAETVNDFLQSLADIAPLDETAKTVPEERPYKCDIHVIPTGKCKDYTMDEFAIPTTYTLDDIIQTEAMARLRNMLYNNYSSEKVQLFDKTPIEDDDVEIDGDAQRGTQKGKDEKGGKGNDDEKKQTMKKKKEK